MLLRQLDGGVALPQEALNEMMSMRRMVLKHEL